MTPGRAHSQPQQSASKDRSPSPAPKQGAGCPLVPQRQREQGQERAKNLIGLLHADHGSRPAGNRQHRSSTPASSLPRAGEVGVAGDQSPPAAPPSVGCKLWSPQGRGGGGGARMNCSNTNGDHHSGCFLNAELFSTAGSFRPHEPSCRFSLHCATEETEAQRAWATQPK